jgi:hypothetical protein
LYTQKHGRRIAEEARFSHTSRWASYTQDGDYRHHCGQHDDDLSKLILRHQGDQELWVSLILQDRPLAHIEPI